MSGLLDLVKDRPIRQFGPGEIVLEEGGQTGVMFVLIAGDVEVLKDEVCVATASQPGVVFGEMSALLGGPHSATVRARVHSTFAVVDHPRAFLEDQPRRASLWRSCSPAGSRP